MGLGRWLLALVLVVSACVEYDTAPCGAGGEVLCPLGKQCRVVEGVPTCVTRAQVDQCDGQPDGATCEYADNLAVHWCQSGACVPKACGDGEIKGLEVCDGLNIGDATCSVVQKYTGTPGCASDCTGFTVGSCVGSCGDGVLQKDSEVCDGDATETTCQDLGYHGGTLGCDQCQSFVTTTCEGWCGDGTVNGDELCDGGNFNDQNCESYLYHDGAGALACGQAASTAQDDPQPLSGCLAIDTEGCKANGWCGDGVINGEEDCDGTLTGVSCTSFGYLSGEVACKQEDASATPLPFGNCTYDFSNCADFCGDGKLGDGVGDAKGELCDAGGLILPGLDCTDYGFYEAGDPTQGTGLSCGVTAVTTQPLNPIQCAQPVTSSCQGYCGDGVINGSEECDVGVVDVDCTNFGYHVPGSVTCGLQADPGEPVSPGQCSVDHSACSQFCGDGILQPQFELCDGDQTSVSCQALGFHVGTVGCTQTTTTSSPADPSGCLILDPSNCDEWCGDGTRNGVELCDNDSFGQLSCTAYGYYSGSLACTQNTVTDKDDPQPLDNCSVVDTSGCMDFCGDGFRNGNEVCDGDQFGALTCASFGFYGGTLTCSQSAITNGPADGNDCSGIDVSNCEGYCGDGVLQVDNGETCDGPLQQDGQSCINYLQTAGALGCDAFCRQTYDLCFVEGRVPEDPQSEENLNDVWALSDDFIVLAGAAGTVRIWDGEAWTVETGVGFGQRIQQVWGTSPSDVWICGAGGKVRHYDGSAWSDRSPPAATNDELRALGGTAPDNVVVGGKSGQLFRWDGSTWTTESVGTGTYYDVWADQASGHMLAVGFQVAAYYDGSEWNSIAYPETHLRAVWGTSNTDWYAGGQSGQLWHFDGSNWTALGVSISASILGLHGLGPGKFFLVGGAGIAQYHDNGVVTDLPGGGPQPLQSVFALSEDNVVMVGSGAALYRWRGFGFQERGSFSAGFLRHIHGTASDDVYVVGVNNPGVRRYDGSSWTQVVPTGWYSGVWAVADDDVWAAGDTGVIHWDGVGWNDVVDPALPPAGRAIWASASNDVWVVGTQGSAAHWDGVSWTADAPVGPTNQLEAVWGFDTGDLYAGGVNGLYRRAPDGSWSQIPGVDHVDGLWGTTPTDLVVIREFGQIYRYDGVDLRLEAAFGTTLRSVYGRRSDDIYVAGQAGRIYRYDGSTWAQFGFPSQGIGFGTFVAPDDDQVFVATQGDVFTYRGTMASHDGGVCDRAIPVYCEQTVVGSTMKQTAAVDSYAGCGNESYPGADVFYRLDVPVSGEATITLRPHDEDLDLLVLGANSGGDCGVGSCEASAVATGTDVESVTLDVAQGQRLYIAVDTPAVGPPSGYTLTVDCTKIVFP